MAIMNLTQSSVLQKQRPATAGNIDARFWTLMMASILVQAGAKTRKQWPLGGAIVGRVDVLDARTAVPVAAAFGPGVVGRVIPWSEISGNSPMSG